MAIAKPERETTAVINQLSLLTRQAQMLASTQISRNASLHALNRPAKGIYNTLESHARAQNQRFGFIGQQIPPLIKERRQS